MRFPRRPEGIHRTTWAVPRAVGLGLAALALAPAPAYAAEASIDHIEEKDGRLQILYSLPAGVAPELDTVTVVLDGTAMEASAEPASASGTAVRRTTVLSMDVSDSMAGDRIEAAKAAAVTFLENAPADLYVGLVTFAGSVETVAAPTTDHEGLGETIAGLQLSRGTRLYEGVTAAVTATGGEGARSVLVLTDGADTTSTPIETTVDAITGATVDDNDVKVDVIAVAQKRQALARLEQIAAAGNGTVLDAAAAEDLEALFTQEAEALAQQVLVTASPPEELRGSEGSLTVSFTAGDETYTDTAYVGLKDLPEEQTQAASPQPSERPFMVSRSVMLLGLFAAALAGAFLVAAAAGGVMAPKPDRVQHSIEAYTRKGAKRLAGPANTPAQGPSVTRQAVGAAAQFLESNKGIEAALGNRLEAAGLQVKPAEWLLIHAGLTLGTGLVGLLVSSGGVLEMLLGLFFGALGPWLFLGLKRSRRVKAFSRQLADTLQLMAGSLSAGLSLAQSVDTVVREGAGPMAHEFRRAIIEARLGVEIEDALEGIADRMSSKDFEWVVMAIRIQREVGGNLAELLTKVAETIREREYLERQVQTLSAEGRLSVWILGGLPPGFMAYLFVANRAYLEPLYTTTIGLVLLGVMSVMLVVGIFWMKKVVKVEV